MAMQLPDPNVPLEEFADAPPDPSPEPSAPAVGGDGPAGAPQQQQATVAPTSDPNLYEVTVGGKKFRVPIDELTRGYSRQQDYTRKTMELAEQRRGWELERQRFDKEVEELKAWLNNPQNVYNYYQQLAQKSGWQPGQPAPAAPGMTPEQIQADIDRRMGEATQKMELQQLTNQYVADIDSAIRSLKQTYPELNRIKGIDRVLRQEVASRDPGNIDEAKRLLGEVAQEQVNELKSWLTEHQKQAVAASAPLKNGIEPPGGSAPRPGPAPKMRLGSQDLMQAVLKDLTDASTADK